VTVYPKKSLVFCCRSVGGELTTVACWPWPRYATPRRAHTDDAIGMGLPKAWSWARQAGLGPESPCILFMSSSLLTLVDGI
jgi:hypothetical protein